MIFSETVQLHPPSPADPPTLDVFLFPYPSVLLCGAEGPLKDIVYLLWLVGCGGGQVSLSSLNSVKIGPLKWRERDREK